MGNSMRQIKVTYDNGETIATCINGTDEEIKRYFAVGRAFNIGSGINDLMAKVVRVEFLN